MTNASHSASVQLNERISLSNRRIKHLEQCLNIINNLYKAL